MKKIVVLALIVSYLFTPVMALELDTSVDDEIRRNYNPSKIEDDYPLPVLPKVLNQDYSKKPSSQIQVSKPIQKSQIQKTSKPAKVSKVNSQISRESYTAIKQGTKIRAKLLSPISDRTKKGTKVSFVSKYPVTTTYFTIPMGTVFTGEVIESHRPQFTGNGGLLVLKITSVLIDGETHPINGEVSEANFKKIFFNNIKGQRKYVSSAFRSMRPGYTFFKKMTNVTFNLARGGSEILLTPFSLAIGVVGLAGNVCAAPLLAVFYKGNSIYFPEGSDFEIKLVQDVFIYN